MARAMRVGAPGVLLNASRPIALAGLVSAGLLLGACTGATVGSGVGEAHLEQAPWYAGRASTGAMRVAWLPVSWQAGASQAPLFEPEGGEGTAVAAMLERMSDHLGTLATNGWPGLAEPLEPLLGTPPDVQFGCEADGFEDCIEREAQDGGFGTGNPRMRLAVGRPSGSWVEDAAVALERSGADALLVLTLEVGQYWPRQTNWRGSKAVELGTDHVLPLPWLTSLDTPVQVLQLTGALVGRDGKAIRIGAEGLLARRTPLLASAFGFQALVGDEEVEALMSRRHEDLPGQPLVWQAAIETLVRELIGPR